MFNVKSGREDLNVTKSIFNLRQMQILNKCSNMYDIIEGGT